MGKQETLEEVSKEYVNGKCSGGIMEKALLSAIEFGAKWQAERMYSEKEVIKISKLAVKEFLETNNFEITYDYQREVFKEFLLSHSEWFEQFKKK